MLPLQGRGSGQRREEILQRPALPQTGQCWGARGRALKQGMAQSPACPASQEHFSFLCTPPSLCVLIQGGTFKHICSTAENWHSCCY